MELPRPHTRPADGFGERGDITVRHLRGHPLCNRIEAIGDTAYPSGPCSRAAPIAAQGTSTQPPRSISPCARVATTQPVHCATHEAPGAQSSVLPPPRRGRQPRHGSVSDGGGAKQKLHTHAEGRYLVHEQKVADLRVQPECLAGRGPRARSPSATRHAWFS